MRSRRTLSRLAHTDGGRVLAAWTAEGAILTLAPVSTRRIGPGPGLVPGGLHPAADHRAGGAGPRREKSRGVLADRVGPPRLAGLQRRPLDALGVARGGPGPCSLVDLRLPHPRAQSLRVDAQPAGDPPDRPLRPRGVSQGLHRHPRRPIPQPDRVPPLPPYAAIPLPPLPPPNPGHNSDIFCRHGPCRRPDSPARREPVPTVHSCLGPPRTRTPANPEAADTGSP